MKELTLFSGVAEDACFEGAVNEVLTHVALGFDDAGVGLAGVLARDWMDVLGAADEAVFAQILLVIPGVAETLDGFHLLIFVGVAHIAFGKLGLGAESLLSYL